MFIAFFLFPCLFCFIRSATYKSYIINTNKILTCSRILVKPILDLRWEYSQDGTNNPFIRSYFVASYLSQCTYSTIMFLGGERKPKQICNEHPCNEWMHMTLEMWGHLMNHVTLENERWLSVHNLCLYLHTKSNHHYMCKYWSECKLSASTLYKWLKYCLNTVLIDLYALLVYVVIGLYTVYIVCTGQINPFSYWLCYVDQQKVL